jgi:predicted AlkP superfamily phosphohydrolase/phosphomutase
MTGKMKKGCVSNDKRDEIISAILDGLANINDSTSGEKLMVEAYRAKDIYSGPYTLDAPDIVFLLEDGRCEIDAKVGGGKLFVEGSPQTHWTGTHTKDGLFIASGPKIKMGFKVGKSNIMDIAPTILHIFGIPQERDMDGRVLHEIFKENLSFHSKVKIHDSKVVGKKQDSELDEEEKALIEARLRNLGYIS